MLENFLHNYKNPAYGPNLVIKQYRSLSKKYSVIYKLFLIVIIIIKMPERQGQVQLGKQGINENFIQTLKEHFNKCKNVKISVLKSARKNKSDVRNFSEEILEKLGRNYTARVVGFTIFVKRWRKNVRLC